MADKKLSEAAGIIGHAIGGAIDSVKGHIAKNKDQQDRSATGQARAGASALDKWQTQIEADWAQYKTIHGVEPNAKGLTRFLLDDYNLDMGQVLADQDAEGDAPVPAKPTPASTPVAPVPAPAPAPAPAAPTPAPTPAAPTPAAPSPAPTPAAPAQTPVNTHFATKVRPKQATPAAPAQISKSDMVAARAHAAIANMAAMKNDPNATQEQRDSARREMQTAMNAAPVRSGRNESIEMDEDVVRDRIKDIDDLPTRVGNTSFRDKTFLDTAKELGLYDKKSIAKKKSKTLTEEPKGTAPGKVASVLGGNKPKPTTTTQAPAKDEPNAPGAPIPPGRLKGFFKHIARYILRDPMVVMASKKFAPKTEDYNKYLAYLRRGVKDPSKVSPGDELRANTNRVRNAPSSSNFNYDNFRKQARSLSVDTMIDDTVEQAMQSGDTLKYVTAMPDGKKNRLVAALIQTLEKPKA